MQPTMFFSLAVLASTQMIGAYAATGTSPVVPTQSPSKVPIPNQLTSQGCFKSGGNLTVAKGVDFVSSGSCWEHCKGKRFYVMGLHASNCYCGMVYPPKNDLTKDSACDYGCPGYNKESCGSLDDGVFSIFNTGVEVAVESQPNESSTSSASSSSTDPAGSSSAETGPASASAEPTESSEPKKKGTNTAAIAAGTVVGVIALAALGGVAAFLFRRRRNLEIEEEHRRNAAVNAFINGSKPPGSSGSISMTDSRLDPVMAHRRLSDGSIADNQDYSRRILRVTNA
ncbi:hypothetical protein BGZ63DRAFT_419643 [Mariannaea sp. PMI_226]|nr:hypothetical protein BGZ63DRAFT_419643 [Mariannaea sp. PMI_226]